VPNLEIKTVYVLGTVGKKGYTPQLRDPEATQPNAAALGTRVHTHWGDLLHQGRVRHRDQIGLVVALNRQTPGLGDEVDDFLKYTARIVRADLLDRVGKSTVWMPEVLFGYPDSVRAEQVRLRDAIVGEDPGLLWFHTRRYFNIGSASSLEEVLNRLLYDPDYRLKLKKNEIGAQFAHFSHIHQIPYPGDNWRLANMNQFLYFIGQAGKELASYEQLIGVMRALSSWSFHGYVNQESENPHVISSGSRWDAHGFEVVEETSENHDLVAWYRDEIYSSKGSKNYLFDPARFDPHQAKQFMDALFSGKIRARMVELKVQTALNGRRTDNDQLVPINFEPEVPDYYYVDVAHSLTSALQLMVRLMDGAEGYHAQRLTEIYHPDKRVRRRAMIRAQRVMGLLLDGVHLQRIYCPFIDNRQWRDTYGVPPNFNSTEMLNRFASGRFIDDIQGVADPNSEGYSLNRQQLVWAITLAHERLVAARVARNIPEASCISYKTRIARKPTPAQRQKVEVVGGDLFDQRPPTWDTVESQLPQEELVEEY